MVPIARPVFYYATTRSTIGFFYNLDVSTLVPTKTPLAAPTSSLEVVANGSLLVRIKFRRGQPPEFEKIAHILAVTPPLTPDGTNLIEIVDKKGKVLYTHMFLVNFNQGDLPKDSDVVTMIFALPDLQDGFEIVVTTADGKVSDEIPPR